MTEQEAIDHVNSGRHRMCFTTGYPRHRKVCGQAVGQGLIWILEVAHSPSPIGRQIVKRYELNYCTLGSRVDLPRLSPKLVAKIEKIILEAPENVYDAE